MSYSKYTLEQLAHLTGTSIEIITYYERIDLLDKQIPKKINFISSPLETVDHVQFMEIGKKLGIGFNVLDELLSLNEMYDPERHRTGHVSTGETFDETIRINVNAEYVRCFDFKTAYGCIPNWIAFIILSRWFNSPIEANVCFWPVSD